MSKENTKTKQRPRPQLMRLLYADDFEERDTVEISNFFCVIDGIGCFTVLERETGFSFIDKDIETGFRDEHDNFWLAAGMFDIRDYLPLTVEEAIKKVKRHSNICKGV